MQIIRFRRSKPAGKNRFVFLSVRRLSGKAGKPVPSAGTPGSCGAAKSTTTQTRGTLSRRSKRQQRGLFRGQGGRAQGVFANPSIPFDECIVLSPVIIPRTKTLARKGVFANPSMQCGGRMYAKAERPSVLPPAGPHCYYTTNKNACLQGRFCETVNAVRRTYVREGRTAFCPAPGRTALLLYHEQKRLLARAFL